VNSIRLQREPFDAAGSRVEPFAEGTRFEKERLWHVELSFAAPITGPLLIGDGRFLGLGLMAPVADIVDGVHVYAIADGLVGRPDPIDVARALRRAVMARVQSIGTRQGLDPFFSGHAANGAPIRRTRSSHLSFAFEADTRRLFILSPHSVERRAPTPWELEHLRTLDLALEGFRELRAGGAGLFTLSAIAHGGDREAGLLGRSHLWKTAVPYVVNHHAKGGTATEALAVDVLAECRRLGLPECKVESSNVRGISGVGLTGNVTLLFKQSVAGPLLLGRTRHLGGGLFRPIEEPDQP
jgi:CRISPR-associated protein Csb2